MPLLFVTDERCARHLTGAHHPERPERLDAVVEGIARSGASEAIVTSVPDPASDDAIERVHDPDYLARLTAFCASGGGALDQDTSVVPESIEAARLAAGSGLTAERWLRAGQADVALCAVRPPGHHARPGSAMGFCLFNNVAVTAASLADRGERVLIVDVDVHHGNGTQEMFWDDPRVGYVSIHQWPLYPGTGSADETGGPGAPWGTLNIPVPAHTTGDVYAAAFDDLIVPFAEEFRPDWLCVSLGFDAHRADPLAQVSLSAGDYGHLVSQLVGLVPTGRCIVLFEGGYDLDAICASTAASVAALVGERVETEARTSGGPGLSVVSTLARRSRAEVRTRVR